MVTSYVLSASKSLGSSKFGGLLKVSVVKLPSVGVNLNKDESLPPNDQYNEAAGGLSYKSDAFSSIFQVLLFSFIV